MYPVAVLLLALPALACGQAAVTENICDCSGKLANLIICGTDGFDYHSICNLKEAQKSDPGLGRRCVGPCGECHQKTTRIPEFCNQRSLEASKKFTAKDFQGITSPRELVELLGIEHAGYGEDHLRRCFQAAMRPNQSGGSSSGTALNPGGQGIAVGEPNGQGTGSGSINGNGGTQQASNQSSVINSDPSVPVQGAPGRGRPQGHRPSRGHRTTGSNSFPDPFSNVCLTDGQNTFDIGGMKEAHCALKANPSLGVRCIGTCAQCNANPGCFHTSR